jgi:hypothetical protein
MRKEQILLKVFKSRKSHVHYYFMILVVWVFVSFLYYWRGVIDFKILIAAAVFTAFVLYFIEVDIVRNWWAITDSFIIESKSILNKNVREIDLNSIADIDLDQPLFKRFLGYGTVNIRKFLNEKSITIPDIDNPEVFINILQDAIQRKKKNDRKQPGL